MRVRSQRLYIRFQTGDHVLCLVDLLREFAQEVVFQPVLLALMICTHQLQPRNVHIQIHLFLDTLVTGTERLDLRIRQRRFVNVLTGTHGRFGCHNLRDEFLLIFNRLPEVSVKRSLRDISVNMDFLVAVALTDDASAALLQIARPPRAVEIMERNKPVLHIHASAHFEGTAHQDAHLSGTHLAEQFLLANLGVCFVDERDLFAWDAHSDQLAANIVVDRKRCVRFHAVFGKLRFQCAKLRAV